VAESLHPEETVTTFVLLRHGHTQQTEQGKLYTDPGAMLTDKGRKQAEALAAWLPKERPDILLSSTAERVRASAELISRELGLEVELVAGLDEQHVGEWEGRSYLEIKKAEPDLYKAWTADPIRNRPPGGESIQDLFERVERDMNNLIARHSGKRIALVTHAGVIRSTIIAALGMPLDNFWRISVPTGSASKIDYSFNFATLQYMSLQPD
jgi:broad specificity phosphatase PhoE